MLLKNISIFLLLVIVSTALGFYWGEKSTLKYLKAETHSSLFLNNSSYKFINPLLDSSETNQALLPSKVSEIKKKVEDLTEQYKTEGKMKSASLYYRDLKNGPRFVTNEDERYTPASLLKVPLLISFFKQTETNPDILNEKITFNVDLIDAWFPQQEDEFLAKYGETYTVLDLIEKMIIHSDNNATQLLQKRVPASVNERVFRDFGIPLPPLVSSRDPFITANEYAGFFRILYNGTYLSHSLSERALEILSRSSYKDGIRKGVPEDIAISSKFGIQESVGEVQLHECGIIYHPIRPFIICIMTTGKDLREQTKFLSEVTKLIYESI